MAEGVPGPPNVIKPVIGELVPPASNLPTESAAQQVLKLQQPRRRDFVSLMAPDYPDGTARTATMVPDDRHRRDPVHGWVHGRHPDMTEEE